MASKTIAERKAELARLQAELDAVLREEKQMKIAEVQQICAEYGLTSEDVFPTAKPKRGIKAGAREAKYSNPATGETWGGMGKRPGWLRGLSDDELAKFKI